MSRESRHQGDRFQLFIVWPPPHRYPEGTNAKAVEAALKRLTMRLLRSGARGSASSRWRYAYHPGHRGRWNPHLHVLWNQWAPFQGSLGIADGARVTARARFRIASEARERFALFES